MVDLLPHNFVLDSTTDTLHVIDLDEGGINNVPGRERPASFKHESDDSKCFLALRYPNLLQKGNRELYTKVQFAAAVLELASISVLTDKKDLLNFQHLREKAKELGNIWVVADAPEADLDEIPTLYSDLIQSIDEKVDAFLGYGKDAKGALLHTTLKSEERN